jgi:hypothetical protein
VMAVDDAKDIYIQCALLHTPGDLTFGREGMLEKLLPGLALYVWGSENAQRTRRICSRTSSFMRR